jgi:hypothetical protein
MTFGKEPFQEVGSSFEFRFRSYTDVFQPLSALMVHPISWTLSIV